MRSQDPTAANPQRGAAQNGASREEVRSLMERSRRRDGPTLSSVEEDYAELLRLRRFPTKRRLPILQDMYAAGTRSGLDPDILGAIEEAIRFEKEMCGREAAWDGRNRRAYARDACEVLPVVTRSLSSIHGLLELTRGSLPEDHPRHQAADRLSAALFPNGVAAITKQAYPVVHSAVGLLLECAAEPGRADDLAFLGLRSQIEDLIRLHREFGEAIQLSEALDHEELKRWRREGQHALCVIIVRVLGVHHGSDAKSRAVREEVLRPVFFHNDQMRRGKRRRATNDAGADPAEA